MNDILFGNNNKAVIKKLANRSFHSNKMRNVIVAIAMLALTTFLFTAVLTIGMGAANRITETVRCFDRFLCSVDGISDGLLDMEAQPPSAQWDCAFR